MQHWLIDQFFKSIAKENPIEKSIIDSDRLTDNSKAMLLESVLAKDSKIENSQKYAVYLIFGGISAGEVDQIQRLMDLLRFSKDDYDKFLLAAIESDNLSKSDRINLVSKLIEKKAEVNKFVSESRMIKMTVLDYTIKYKRKELVNLLLDKKSQIIPGNLSAYDVRSPLYWAIDEGDAAIVEILLNRKAEVFSTGSLLPISKKDEVIEMLHLAVKKPGGVIRAILSSHIGQESIRNKEIKQIVNGEEQFNYRRFLLHDAMINENLMAVKMLLDLKADPTKKNNEGKTPLFYALQTGRVDLIKAIFEKLNKSKIKKYIDKQEVGFLALHLAISRENEEMTMLLLENKIDVNQVDHDGDTPLHESVRKAPKMVEKLLAAKADVTKRNKRHMTPLHYAAQSGTYEVVEKLLAKKADYLAKNSDGVTPLHYAVRLGNLPIVDALLKLRANLSVVDNMKNSLLHYAAQSNDENVIEIMLENKLNVNEKNSEDKTPLYYAVRYGQGIAVQKLIEAKVNLNARDKFGRTAMHYANVVFNY